MNRLSGLLLGLFICGTATAKLAVDSVFSSNMVLQQERPIAFFGTATPKTPIAVTFAGKTITAGTADNGEWRVEFPAMKAGKTAYTVSIKGDGATKVLNNILIGDVWICSGQSNMAMPIGAKFNRGWSAQNCEQEVARANYPDIRYASQSCIVADEKPAPARYSMGRGWVVCSPKIAHLFSATAYFFGRKLHQDLQIPIGLINTSWSGSIIQPWISDEGYRAYGPQMEQNWIAYVQGNNGKNRDIIVQQEKNRYQTQQPAWHLKYMKIASPKLAAQKGFEQLNFDDSAWKKSDFNSSNNYVTRLYRNVFELNPALRGKDLDLVAHSLGDVVDVYLNGKRIAGWVAGTDLQKKTLGRLRIPAATLKQQGKNILAVRADFFYRWQNRGQMYQLLRFLSLQVPEQRTNKQTFTNWKQLEVNSCTAKEVGEPCPKNYEIYYKKNTFPGNLYRGMVHAWTKLPVRGVIWYQGCSNAGSMHYYALLKTLIADWRARWKQPDMPFIIVQLAGFGPGNATNWKTMNPNGSFGYALTRDIQQQMLKIKHVGLATAIDIGEPTNIHPANKQDVGKRLALEAERIAYGKDVVSRGPLFQKAVPEGKAIRVFFDYAQGGLKTADGKAPGAFAVAGADKQFVWAEARIDGANVVVSSPAVPAPKYVRYAYVSYRGDCNLQNQEGLPAYPFRSDAVDYSKAK